MLVAQISDPHVSEAGVGPDAQYGTGRHLQDAVQRLQSLPGLSAVIVTGDLADIGSRAEYERIGTILAPLQAPVYLVPGNHDDSDTLRAAFPQAGYFPASGKLHYVVDDLPVRFVFLDSVVKGAMHGELGDAQLAWLDRTLADARERPTVVVLHHPPFVSGMKRMDRWRLMDAAALEAVVQRHPQVERVVCGHLHRPVVRRFGGTIVQVCPSTAQQLGLDLADPGNSLTVTKEPPAALLHCWDGQALVTHQIYLQHHGTYERVEFGD